jgi:hypothetical protein
VSKILNKCKKIKYYFLGSIFFMKKNLGKILLNYKKLLKIIKKFKIQILIFFKKNLIFYSLIINYIIYILLLLKF